MVPDKKFTNVTQRHLRCSGYDEETKMSGHPTIYLEMGTSDQVACPYCAHIFVFHDIAAEASAVESAPETPSGNAKSPKEFAGEKPHFS